MQAAHTVKRFVEQEDGAAASEYAIVVALIATAIASAVTQFDLEPVFSSLESIVRTATGL